MAGKCCNLVGNFFDTGFNFPGNGCFISVNNNINTDFGSNYGCDNLDISGQTTGSLNLAGYAGNEVYYGCPGRAGVQILWTRKYDCSEDYVHFVFSGGGRSFKYGDVDDYLSLKIEYSKTTRILNASSQSGPQSMYTDIEQVEGIGMAYTKGPITFDTAGEATCTLTNMGVGTSDYYLQNFNIEFVPGAIPVANYTFAYSA